MRRAVAIGCERRASKRREEPPAIGEGSGERDAGVQRESGLKGGVRGCVGLSRGRSQEHCFMDHGTAGLAALSGACSCGSAEATRRCLTGLARRKGRTHVRGAVMGGHAMQPV